jgi:hypothetical protein
MRFAVKEQGVSNGHAMAQAVSRRPLKAETKFAPWSIHMGFLVEEVALGRVFLRVLRISLSISFHRCSPNSYQLGDEQYVRQWQQFRDVSPNPNQSINQGASNLNSTYSKLAKLLLCKWGVSLHF